MLSFKLYHVCEFLSAEKTDFRSPCHVWEIWSCIVFVLCLCCLVASCFVLKPNPPLISLNCPSSCVFAAGLIAPIVSTCSPLPCAFKVCIFHCSVPVCVVREPMPSSCHLAGFVLFWYFVLPFLCHSSFSSEE